MILATLCLQASLLAHPLYLDAPKPELRSAQHILLFHDEMEGLSYAVGRDEAGARLLMSGLRERVLAGEDFGQVSLSHSNAGTSRFGGSLGSFPEGMLKPDFNDFLFGAGMGEMSSVLVNEQGVHLLRRVPTYAGLMQIQFAGTDAAAEARAREVMQQLAAGANFADMAKKHSVDPISRDNGGMYRVFERGSRDSLIKRQAFEASLGEVIGPIKTPLGYHVLMRAEADGFPGELWDDNFIRARGILVTHLKALGVPKRINRTQSEAKLLAEEVIQRVEGGESFAVIAARFNDDPGGLQRSGDLGWVHRQNPDLPAFFGSLFLAQPGTMTQAVLTPVGVVVLIREK
ncbi:MAG: parvulin-like peptidyl-prolyl isomerase [Candidatus Paceibacteria bacterium]|jgi:parvulin-like peptidyl-prolyl isomerase